MASANHETVEDLNQLLRGEISAAETYKQAIDTLKTDQTHASEADALRQLQRDHGTNAQQIRHRIESLGGEASDSSGPWGAFAKSVQGAADLFGEKSALKALKEGEEHGLHSFERKLSDGRLDSESAAVVQAMIPKQKQHIQMLDTMMQSS